MLHVIGRAGHLGQNEILPIRLKVSYQEEAQGEYSSGLLDELVKPDGLVMAAARSGQSASPLVFQNPAMFVASLKHLAYEAEREVRFVVTRKPDDALSFRPSPRGIIPYLRLGGTIKSSTGVFQLPVDPPTRPPLPIGDLFVGPSQGESEEHRVGSMREFITVHGYAATVQGAEIPYLP